MEYTAIFLTNGLCVVYHSLPQCPPLVYPGWGQKSEYFCLLVTPRRLRGAMVVGYCSTTAALLRYPTAKAFEIHQGKGQSKVPRRCLPGGYVLGHRGVFTIVHGSEGLHVVPHYAHVSQCPSGVLSVVLFSGCCVPDVMRIWLCNKMSSCIFAFVGLYSRSPYK